MKVTVGQDAGSWLIRLEGGLTLGSAAEFKTLLLQWIATGKNLELDLERAEEIDITFLQLLGAAAREAIRSRVTIAGRASSAVESAAHDAGFDQMPGFPFRNLMNRVEVAHG